MQTPASAKTIPLSPIEDLFWRIEESVSGAFRVAILFRVEGCIEEDLLTTALQRIQQRHPKLRASIRAGKKRRFCYKIEDPALPIPFEILDCGEEEAPWREETRRLLQLRFPPNGPLVAITILRSRARRCSELLLTAHHAIADGNSAIMLVDNLLAEYADAEQRVSSAPVPALPLITTARAKQSTGIVGQLRLIRRVVQLQREEKRLGHTPLPAAVDIPPQSQWVRWLFSREETVAIVRRCRKERTSLGAAMIAAVFCGLTECIVEPTARFRCQFPLDLRGVLKGPNGPVTAQDLGCFVTMMSEFYDVQRNQQFWELARSVHHRIQWFTQQGGPAFHHNATSAALKLADWAPRGLLAASETRVTLLATNYGVLNVRDSYGSLRPRECTLLFKSDAVGPSLILEALVMGQRLNLGFAADNLDPAFWEQLTSAVRRHVNAAAADGVSALVFDKTQLTSCQAAVPHQRISVAPHE